MDINNIPIIINCRDRVTALVELVEWLESIGMQRIYLLDNDSTYEPLLEFYSNSPHEIILLGANAGHAAPWISGVAEKVAEGSYYVVSDPDIVPVAECPTDAIGVFYEALNRYGEKNKVGFGLKIDDIPDNYQHKHRVISYESQFWHPARCFDGFFYDSPIDTTFALYRPGTTQDISHSVRTGDPYIARHLAWYINTSDLTEEELWYRSRAAQNVTSWNKEEGPHWA